MKFIVFKEKHENRYVYGETYDVICAMVLKDRIMDGYWYDEDTDNAVKALNEGKAYQYLSSRRDYEYEGLEESTLELADAALDYEIL